MCRFPCGSFTTRSAAPATNPTFNKLIAVGQVFLPRTDFGAQERCRTIVESEVLRMGHYIYGWRHVPVDVSVLGEKANATRPEIEQILIRCEKDIDQGAVRARAVHHPPPDRESRQRRWHSGHVSVQPVVPQSIIYKGMMLAEQVSPPFTPILMDERFESAFAIYHQRYSTNTFPQWWLAQPFRMLAHNGEINTLKGNVNWMKSHEIRMASSAFGDMAEDIKPIIPGGHVGFRRAGRGVRGAGALGPLGADGQDHVGARSLVQGHHRHAKAWADMYAYCNSVMEPWDGPAALAMTDGRWVCGGLDRNGLRPMRYVVTGDGMLIAGSEAGMVPVDETHHPRKGRAWPGADDRRRYGVGQALPRCRDQGQTCRQPALWRLGRQGVGPERAAERRAGQAEFTGPDLRKRQIAAGYTVEELEQVLAPMAEDGKEMIASHGR
jgi:glutamate synthase (NADPH/NADH) large chain